MQRPSSPVGPSIAPAQAPAALPPTSDATPPSAGVAPPVSTAAAPAPHGALIPVPPSGQAEPLIPPRHRRRRIVLIVLLLLAGLGGGGWLFLGQAPLVTLVQPMRGPAIEAVYATGIVEAIDTARAGTTVAGRVIAVPVQEGDVVRAGQVLALLDPRQAQQRLEDARARLDLAEQELARDRALVGTGVRTLQALQRSEAERDRAAAAVTLAARELDEHRIVSPLDGVVMRRDVEPGNTAAAATGLFTVASTKRLRVAADVDERDIAQVRMGARMAIHADAYPAEAFVADVTNIRRQGDTATRTFRVEANLPADTKLFIGMTVDTNIVVAERPDALLLPPASVRHDPPQGGRPGPAYVFRVADGVAHRVPVTLGAIGSTAIEVRDGIGPEDAIVLEPSATLTDGMRVRVRP